MKIYTVDEMLNDAGIECSGIPNIEKQLCLPNRTLSDAKVKCRKFVKTENGSFIAISPRSREIKFN